MSKQKQQKKRIREIETRKKFNGEQSPYWNFMESHASINSDGGIEENVFANPDMLSEDDRAFHRPLSERGEAQLEAIHDVMKDLSPQQQRVLYLCGQMGMTQEEAAKELGTSQQAVGEVLQRARKIILAHYKKCSE